jgi:hypothetical protein
MVEYPRFPQGLPQGSHIHPYLHSSTTKDGNFQQGPPFFGESPNLGPAQYGPIKFDLGLGLGGPPVGLVQLGALLVVRSNLG